MHSLDVVKFLVLNRDESVDLALSEHDHLIKSENNFVNIQLLYDFVRDYLHYPLWKLLRSLVFLLVEDRTGLHFVLINAALFKGHAF